MRYIKEALVFASDHRETGEDQQQDRQDGKKAVEIPIISIALFSFLVL